MATEAVGESPGVLYYKRDFHQQSPTGQSDISPTSFPKGEIAAVDRLFSRFEKGMRSFANIPFAVWVEYATIFHYARDASGNKTLYAQLFLTGRDDTFGRIRDYVQENPDPKSGRREVMAHAVASYAIWTPDETSAMVIHKQDDLYSAACRLLQQKNGRFDNVDALWSKVSEHRSSPHESAH